MRAHDLRATAKNDRAASVVRQLFLTLGRGGWGKAAPLLSEPVDIFGRLVTRVDIARNDDKSLQGVLDRLDELPEGEVEMDLLAQLVGLELSAEDRIFFATTRVNDEPVTYGLVVRDGDRGALVRALFDPRAFKAWALSDEAGDVDR